MATFYKVKTLTEEEIIEAVEKKKKGTYRKISWVTGEFEIGSQTITVIKTGFARLGIEYSHMAAVKAKEGEKTRFSSFVHSVDEEGELLDPPYIVRDRKTETNKYLLCCNANVYNIKTKKPRMIEESFYCDGKLIDLSMREDAKKKLTEEWAKHKKKSGGKTNAWVLPLQKIKKII